MLDLVHIGAPGPARNLAHVRQRRTRSDESGTERRGIGSGQVAPNFARLNAAEQLLVLVDIERVSRGEAPVVGVSARLDRFAQEGAAARTDPALPSASDYPGATGGFVANWAGALSALDANYVWMYTDGWAGRLTDNYDCTGPSASGCWGHRDNILANGSRLPCPVSTCALVMGGGFVNAGGGDGFSSTPSSLSRCRAWRRFFITPGPEPLPKAPLPKPERSDDGLSCCQAIRSQT